eukprot:4146460-Amphidinium_carterae.1
MERDRRQRRARCVRQGGDIPRKVHSLPDADLRDRAEKFACEEIQLTQLPDFYTADTGGDFSSHQKDSPNCFGLAKERERHESLRNEPNYTQTSSTIFGPWGN